MRVAVAVLIPLVLLSAAVVSAHHDRATAVRCDGDWMADVSATGRTVVTDETEHVSRQECVRRVVMEAADWSRPLATDLADQFTALGWTMQREGPFGWHGVLVDRGRRHEVWLDRAPMELDDDGDKLPQEVTLQVTSTRATTTRQSNVFVASAAPRYYGDVVIVPGYESVVGLDEEGAIVWETGCLHAAWWSPVQGPATELVPVVCDLELVGLRTTDGEVGWRRPSFDSPHRRVGADVLAATTEGTILAVDLATGEDRWAVPVRAQLNLAVDADRVYTASDFHTVAYDTEDGSVVWEQRWSTVGALAAGGDLYVRSSDVLRLDPDDGEMIWQAETDDHERLGRSDLYAVTEDVVVVVKVDDTSDDPIGLVTAYDRERGKEQWHFDGSGSGAQVLAGRRFVVVNEPAVARATVVDGRDGSVIQVVENTPGCAVSPDDEDLACAMPGAGEVGVTVTPIEG